MFNAALIFSVLGLATLVGSALAWFRRANQVNIPSNRSAFLSLWILAVLLGGVSFFSAGSGWLSGIFGGIAAIGGAFLLSLYVLRKQGVGDPITVGDHIPDFESVDSDGAIFNSTTLAGTPTLVKFFRGHW